MDKNNLRNIADYIDDECDYDSSDDSIDLIINSFYICGGDQ